MRRSFRITLALALVAVTGCKAAPAGGGSSAAAVDPSLPAIEARDPWTSDQLISPAALAKQLASGGAKPAMFHVGFHILYEQGAIPGSSYVGAGSTDTGIAALKDAVKSLPKDADIVIYCGCCPWDHCPNMRPAFAALKELGYTHVHALAVKKNLDDDWAGKGYPIAKPAS